MRMSIEKICMEMRKANKKGTFEVVSKDTIKISGVQRPSVNWADNFPYYSEYGIISDGRGNEVKIIWA